MAEKCVSIASTPKRYFTAFLSEYLITWNCLVRSL